MLPITTASILRYPPTDLKVIESLDGSISRVPLVEKDGNSWRARGERERGRGKQFALRKGTCLGTMAIDLNQGLLSYTILLLDMYERVVVDTYSRAIMRSIATQMLDVCIWRCALRSGDAPCVAPMAEPSLTGTKVDYTRHACGLGFAGPVRYGTVALQDGKCRAFRVYD